MVVDTGDTNGKPLVIGVFVSTASEEAIIRRISMQAQSIIRTGNQSLEDAVPVAKKMEQEGVEVIISRRGTAYVLRESLHIPVLSFPQSSWDVLITVREAAKIGRKIFMPRFRTKREGIEMIGELLGVEFAQGIYTDSASFRKIISRAARDGFDVVVGGGATLQYAEEFGIKFCELIASEEEVLEKLENAKSVALAQREQKATAQRYQTIIDAASDGIIATDTRGNVTTINRSARRILNVQGNHGIGVHISSLIPNSYAGRVLQDKLPVRDKVENIRNEMFIFNHTPVMLGEDMVGVVSTFKEAANVVRAENTVRRTLAKGFVAKYTIDDLTYRHPSMKKVADLCREFARTDSFVLITGETGTGKEIVAESIHNLSRRKARPFVSVQCAALPEPLLESELFGYEEGAFTGSKKGGKPGLFELAHQGTIFLDEIDSTPLNVQVRLLRVLQEKEVMRLGSEQMLPVDVRVIVAAGRDLWEAVQEGAFRKDLFFRLNVLRISVPPLRARREDIPELLKHFLYYYAKKYNIAPIQLPGSYMEKLMNYSWPGNVRQIMHFAEQLLLNSRLECNEEILDGLFLELDRITELEGHPVQKSAILQPGVDYFPPSERESDAGKIRAALEKTRFNRTKAAVILGISRGTLWRKMKEHGLE